MNLLPGIVLALLIILAISYLRSYIIRELQVISLLTTGSHRTGIFIYSIILLPGTVLHELSHWLIAELLRVPTGEIRILPSIGDDDTREHNLGSVKTARTDPFRGFLIGIAPFLTGIFALTLLSAYFNNLKDSPIDWKVILVGYLILITSNSMLTSREDRRHLPVVVLLSLTVGVFGYLNGLSIPPNFISKASELMRGVNESLMISTMINIISFLVLYISRLTLERATRQHIRIK